MNGRWEVHCDPYDVTAVWIRDHHQGGWITAPWVHRDLVGQPFGAAIYEHVRAQSARTGAPIRDDYIARRIAELLGAGPHDEHSPGPTPARLPGNGTTRHGRDAPTPPATMMTRPTLRGRRSDRLRRTRWSEFTPC